MKFYDQMLFNDGFANGKYYFPGLSELRRGYILTMNYFLEKEESQYRLVAWGYKTFRILIIPLSEWEETYNHRVFTDEEMYQKKSKKADEGYYRSLDTAFECQVDDYFHGNFHFDELEDLLVNHFGDD